MNELKARAMAQINKALAGVGAIMGDILEVCFEGNSPASNCPTESAPLSPKDDAPTGGTVQGKGQTDCYPDKMPRYSDYLSLAKAAAQTQAPRGEYAPMPQRIVPDDIRPVKPPEGENPPHTPGECPTETCRRVADAILDSWKDLTTNDDVKGMIVLPCLPQFSPAGWPERRSKDNVYRIDQMFEFLANDMNSLAQNLADRDQKEEPYRSYATLTVSAAECWDVCSFLLAEWRRVIALACSEARRCQQLETRIHQLVEPPLSQADAAALAFRSYKRFLRELTFTRNRLSSSPDCGKV